MATARATRWKCWPNGWQRRHSLMSVLRLCSAKEKLMQSRGLAEEMVPRRSCVSGSVPVTGTLGCPALSNCWVTGAESLSQQARLVLRLVLRS